MCSFRNDLTVIEKLFNPKYNYTKITTGKIYHVNNEWKHQENEIIKEAVRSHYSHSFYIFGHERLIVAPEK